MAKNRVIYQTEALYVSETAQGAQWDDVPTHKIHQLHRVQSVNYGYQINRRDVNQFGELAAIDRIITETPTVNLDFSYLNQSFYNEYQLGFYVANGTEAQKSCISRLLDKTADEKNYFIKTVSEGVDAIGNLASNTGSGLWNQTAITPSLVAILGIGNGFISNFTTEAAVGDFPRTTVQVEAMNISVEGPHPSVTELSLMGYYRSGVVVYNPAIDPVDGAKIYTKSSDNGIQYSIIPRAVSNPYAETSGMSSDGLPDTSNPIVFRTSVLRPGDVTLSLWKAGSNLQSGYSGAGANISDAKIQSYSLSFGLTREPLQKLGSKYAFAREVTYPVAINLRIDANVGELTTGNLADFIQTDESYDALIRINHPTLTTSGAMIYWLKEAKVDSQNFSSSIGPNKSVTLNFTSQIGGPLQTTKGLFFSGAYR